MFLSGKLWKMQNMKSDKLDCFPDLLGIWVKGNGDMYLRHWQWRKDYTIHFTCPTGQVKN
jgi:hypothetical protein